MFRFHHYITGFVLITFSSALANLYPSSIVGTDFDFIKTSDPTSFTCFRYEGKATREMPDKRFDSKELNETVHVFQTYFSDGTTVEFNMSQDLGDKSAVEDEIQKYTERLGRLPTKLRSGLDRIIVHKGDESAFAEIGFVILYSDNATKRILTSDLEETMFHESIHAVLDSDHAGQPEWINTQALDGAFVTDYGARNSGKEDLAESAIFAYTIARHQNRFPEADLDKIKTTIPNRIKYINQLLPADQPTFYSVGTPYDCSGNAPSQLKPTQEDSPAENQFTNPDSNRPPSLPSFDETKSSLHARLNQHIILLLKTDPVAAQIRHNYYAQILDHLDEFKILKTELTASVKSGNSSREAASSIYKAEAKERRAAITVLLQEMKVQLKELNVSE